MIEINHLKKSFEGREVLKDISSVFMKGKTNLIIGQSGSGKTVLLKSIVGLIDVDMGEILFDGRDIRLMNFKEKKQLRQEMGMVFQGFNLFPHMSVLENIIEAPIHVNKENRESVIKRALVLLEKVGLSEKANSYPQELSGGQKQRVAIARALAMNPDIMLFDEPTSALDPELVGEVLKVIRELAEEKITMLIVTHEMKFAREISDRIIFMEKGEIIESAHPKKLFENPDHPRIIEFLKKMI